MRKRLQTLRFLLLLVLAWSPLVSAQQAQQQSRRAFGYGFVSPNTREDMKLDEAIKGMNSAEESKLLNEAVNLGCVVRSRIRAARALGVWSDGAEFSVMMRVNSDEETLRYLMSRHRARCGAEVCGLFSTFTQRFSRPLSICGCPGALEIWLR